MIVDVEIVVGNLYRVNLANAHLFVRKCLEMVI